MIKDDYQVWNNHRRLKWNYEIYKIKLFKNSVSKTNNNMTTSFLAGKPWDYDFLGMYDRAISIFNKHL